MKLFDLIKNIDIIHSSIDLKDDINNFEICNITRNSLDVKINSAFICQTGTKTDGHKYIGEAVKNGAALVILEYKPGDFDGAIKDTPYIIVRNARKTEAQLWMTWYGEPVKTGNIKVIGVTGTNGKTSVTYMIRKILEDSGYKTALFGTIKYIIDDKIEEESKLTTSDPDELARLFSLAKDAGVEYAVMEISSHSLELDKVAGLDIIELGIFTNLTQDHLDFHQTMENYKKAKAKLFKMCRTGILNADDKASGDIIEISGNSGKNYLYGIKSRNNNPDFYADNIKYLGADGIKYDFCIGGSSFDEIKSSFKIESPTVGEFYVYNSMAAAACGIILGIDEKIIADALSKVKIKGRMEKLDIDTPYSIFIDYAHTPDALESVLKAVRGFSGTGRVICVFGCGGDRDRSKRPEMGRIAAANADFTIISSDNSRTEEPADIIRDIVAGIDIKSAYEPVIDRRKAIELAMDKANPGDIILLAGKGHEEYIDEKGEVKYFSEREVVAEILRA